MSVFDKKVNNCSRLDWRILMNGYISLYNSEKILKQDMNWLEKQGYQLKIFDFEIIETEEIFHRVIKKNLEFPEYYGENLPALNDCLLHDLFIPINGGVAMIFMNFDKFYKKDMETAYEILKCFELNSRRRLLYGERLITLLQLCDKEIVLKDIGQHSIMWNLEEFR